MTAFDITPLQIPVADPAAMAGGVDTMKYAISAHPGTLPRAKMSSACKFAFIACILINLIPFINCLRRLEILDFIKIFHIQITRPYLLEEQTHFLIAKQMSSHLLKIIKNVQILILRRLHSMTYEIMRTKVAEVRQVHCLP